MKISRREMISATAACAGILLAGPTAQAAGKPAHRVLGRTGLKVSEVGMGVMITSDSAVVRAALDAGITYFDTARSYMGGRNERILAEGLRGRRGEAVVATKCHRLGSREAVLACVEESLRALETDYIDILQLHGLSDRRQVQHEGNLEALRQLKESGKIRFAGVTTHTGMVEVMDAAVAAGVYDTVLTVFNFQSPPEVARAVEAAAAAGVGVVAMKVMTGGYQMTAAPGFSPYQSALRWVLQQKGVATAIPSMTTLEQLRDDAAVMGTTLTWRDRTILDLYGAAVAERYCRSCGDCRGRCPRGADPPTALRALMYAEGYGQPQLARETLSGITLPCAGCDTCSIACRFGLPVRDRLLAAAHIVEQARA